MSPFGNPIVGAVESVVAENGALIHSAELAPGFADAHQGDDEEEAVPEELDME